MIKENFEMYIDFDKRIKETENLLNNLKERKKSFINSIIEKLSLKIGDHIIIDNVYFKITDIQMNENRLIEYFMRNLEKGIDCNFTEKDLKVTGKIGTLTFTLTK